MTATEGSNLQPVAVKFQAIKKYLDECLGHFNLGDLQEGEKDSPRVMMKLHEAAFAVKRLLHRISAAQEGALFIALMKGELAGTNMMKQLPQELASIAALLEIDWEKEAASMRSDEADIAIFFAKMPRFETAMSLVCGESELQKKEIEALSELTKKCETFKEVFIQQLEKAIAATKHSMIERFDSFVLKYQEFEEATKEWKMDKFNYLFEDDNEDEVQKDIEGFKTVHAEFLELAGKISGAMEQRGVSQSADLKHIMVECQSFVDLGSSKARSGALYSALLLFSHCIVKHEGSEVENVESYLQKTFGKEVALDKMPEKVIGLVKDLVSASKKGSTASPGQGEKKPKKEKKDKKDKEHEKKHGKDEKSQKGTKRAAGEEAKGSKEKKEKKRK